MDNPKPLPELDDATFERAMAFMRKNFRSATLADVAAHVDLSPFHFHRVFKHAFELSPLAYRKKHQST